jgi:hypothetical protein
MIISEHLVVSLFVLNVMEAIKAIFLEGTIKTKSYLAILLRPQDD